MRMRGIAVLAATVIAATTAASLGETAGASTPSSTTPAAQLRTNSPAPAHVVTRPYRSPFLVADPAAYARQKAAANAAAPSRQSTSTAPRAPDSVSTSRSWQGISSTSSAPSDSTGAIGTTRYVETVNSLYAVYNRTSNTPVDRGALTGLMGCATSSCSDDRVFDPQIIWDAGTNRFYYTADNITHGSGGNLLNIGFSKTATPTSSADWCKYSLPYFGEFPDYPKLGDTSNFMLIGTNVFASTSGSYKRSDVVAISKPAAGSTCPSGSTFQVTIKKGIKNSNGSGAFTPVPANQIDPSSTGWVVAGPLNLPASSLSVFQVTRSSTGAAVISAGSPVAVPSFTVPPNAPQKGTAKKLDTSDTRNTQAVSAIDPTRGTVGLWTQHTIQGGVGSVVRWYEINPAAHTLFQSGTITSSTDYVFNGAISPDRVANGTTRAFGSNMLIHFNRSGTGTFPALWAASKIGANPVTTPVEIAISSGPDIGFDCSSGTCRWGDYAAATPDPAASPTGATGQVWGTSMLAFASSNTSLANWTTWNFAAKP